MPGGLREAAAGDAGSVRMAVGQCSGTGDARPLPRSGGGVGVGVGRGPR